MLPSLFKNKMLALDEVKPREQGKFRRLNRSEKVFLICVRLSLAETATEIEPCGSTHCGVYPWVNFDHEQNLKCAEQTLKIPSS